MSNQMAISIINGDNKEDNMEAIASIIQMVRFFLDAYAERDEPIPDAAALGISCCLDLASHDIQIAGKTTNNTMNCGCGLKAA